jgi:peroxiredoxin
MPSIETLYNRYKNRSLQILAVSVQEEPSVVKTFVTQNAFTFPIALDPNGEAAQLYGIRGIPTTFLIDQKGTLLGALVGGKEWSTPEVYALLDALLKD